MMHRIVIAAAVIGMVSGIPATAQPAPDCLRNAQIYDYKTVRGNRTLIVTDKFRRAYRISFVTPCYNLQHQFGIGFRTFGAGSLSCVTRGDQVVMRDPVGPNQCRIASVEPYTRAMEQQDAALNDRR